MFVRAELSPRGSSGRGWPFGLAAVRWELRGRARFLDAELHHQVVGFGELDGGEGVPAPGADPVPGGVKDEHGREPLDIPGASTSALITLSILCDSDPVQAGRTLEAMQVPVCMCMHGVIPL